MLWSLFKIILFVVLVAALAFGAGMLIETDAALRVAFGGWEFTLKPLQAVIVGALLLVAVWLFIKLLGLLLAVIKFISGDETAISRYFNRNRERRGFKALADGMMALASGDGREAIAKATKAQRLLNRPELTNLLTAQAAELAEARKDEVAATLQANLAKVLQNSDGVDADRVAQELAMLAVKADVTEEIDRLGAHVTAARDLLSGGGLVGRKLDFLMQEFNREANTLCSKSQNTDLTRVGLALKALIDQMPK